MFGLFSKKQLPENSFASSLILSRCVVARMIGKDFDKVPPGKKYHFFGSGQMNYVSVRVSDVGLAQVGVEGIYSLPHDDIRPFGTVIVLGCEYLAGEQVAEPNPFDRDELRNALLIWGTTGYVESIGLKDRLSLERRMLLDSRRHEAYSFPTARLHEIMSCGDVVQRVQQLSDLLRSLSVDVDCALRQCGLGRFSV